jgi:hypothetical protein
VNVGTERNVYNTFTSLGWVFQVSN